MIVSLSLGELFQKGSSVVEVRRITAEEAGQRLDNFLIGFFKKVPKSRVYKAIRKGECRVNSGRINPLYRLKAGDQLRIPPLQQPAALESPPVASDLLFDLDPLIQYEDEGLLVLDKPAGLPVHGGTGLTGGLIHRVQCLRPQKWSIKLIHRLDKETSGCLLLAKKRTALLDWQQYLLSRDLTKTYLLLVAGHWPANRHLVDLPLLKHVVQGGERRVVVDPQGKPSKTIFKPITYFKTATLLSARLLTGRTHQIRVHAAAMGHPVAGDSRYGERAFNQQMRHCGLKRLFLHAESLVLRATPTCPAFSVSAPLPDALAQVVSVLTKSS